MQDLLSQLSDAAQLCLVLTEPTPEKREEILKQIDETQKQCDQWNSELVKLRTTPALYCMWEKLTDKICDLSRSREFGFANIQRWKDELKPKELFEREKLDILRPKFILLNEFLIENYLAERDETFRTYIDFANDDLEDIEEQYNEMGDWEFHLGELYGELETLKKKNARYNNIQFIKSEIAKQRKLVNEFDREGLIKKKELIDELFKVFNQFDTSKYFSVLFLERKMAHFENIPQYFCDFDIEFRNSEKVNIFEKRYGMNQQEYFKTIKSAVNGIVDVEFDTRGFIESKFV